MPRRTTKSKPGKTTHEITTTTTDKAALEQVLKWVLAGHSEADIEEAIGKSWPDKPPAALILAAGDHLRASASFDVRTVLGWCIEALRDLYKRMVDIGDYAGAIRAV
jgi:hypothetical protein